MTVKINKIIVAIVFTLVVASSASALPEKYYQKKWCESKGRTEVVLSDNTRCDCLTETHAIEIGTGKTWYNNLGQALHYSTMTGKKAGVVLIVESDKYLNRLKATIKYHGLDVDVWTIKADK
jgi:hypothetical protein